MKSWAFQILDGKWKKQIQQDFTKLMQEQSDDILRNQMEELLNRGLRKMNIEMFGELRKALQLLKNAVPLTLYNVRGLWFYQLWQAVNDMQFAYKCMMNRGGNYSHKTFVTWKKFHDLWDKYNFGIDERGFPLEVGVQGVERLFNLAEHVLDITVNDWKVIKKE